MPSSSHVPISYLTPWQRLYYTVLGQLQSMELALVLMVTLALASMLGTFIPQQGVATAMQMQRFAGDAYPWLKALGWFDVFGSPWFLTLGVWFFICLVCGSWRWLRPAVRQVFDTSFMSLSHARCHSQSCVLPNLASADWVNRLQQQGFRVKLHPNGHALYADKGRWHRLGSSVVHTGLVLLLLACGYGALVGFTAQQVSVPTQTFVVNEASLLKTNLPVQGGWVGQLPNYRITVNDFKVDYYASHPTQPQQFTSQLTVSDPQTGKVQQGTVSVNHPLVFRGSQGDLTVYQATYSVTDSLRLKVGQQVQTVDASTAFLNRRVGVMTLPNKRAFWVIPFTRLKDGVHSDQVHLLPVQANALGKGSHSKPIILTEAHPTTTVAGVPMTFLGPVVATGLQLKHAPEVPWLYTAFALIVLGALWSLPAHWRLWLCYDADAQQWIGVTKAHKQAAALRRVLTKVV